MTVDQAKADIHILQVRVKNQIEELKGLPKAERKARPTFEGVDFELNKSMAELYKRIDFLNNPDKYQFKARGKTFGRVHRSGPAPFLQIDNLPALESQAPSLSKAKEEDPKPLPAPDDAKLTDIAETPYSSPLSVATQPLPAIELSTKGKERAPQEVDPVSVPSSPHGLSGPGESSRTSPVSAHLRLDSAGQLHIVDDESPRHSEEPGKREPHGARSSDSTQGGLISGLGQGVASISKWLLG